MKKLNNKGFMLAETLIVVTVVAAFIIFIYSQVHSIINNYNDTMNYQTTNAIYVADNVKNLIYNDNKLNTLISRMGGNSYVKVATSDFSTAAYASELYTISKVKSVILAKNNINILKQFGYNNDFNANLKAFIKTMRQEGDTNGYVLIVELTNGEYASLVMTNNTKEMINITGSNKLTMRLGNNLDLKTGLTATGSSGSVNNLITCVGTPNLNLIGKYTVNCFVETDIYTSNIFLREIEVQA